MNCIGNRPCDREMQVASGTWRWLPVHSKKPGLSVRQLQGQTLPTISVSSQVDVPDGEYSLDNTLTTVLWDLSRGPSLATLGLLTIRKCEIQMCVYLNYWVYVDVLFSNRKLIYMQLIIYILKEVIHNHQSSWSEKPGPEFRMATSL